MSRYNGLDFDSPITIRGNQYMMVVRDGDITEIVPINIYRQQQQQAGRGSGSEQNEQNLNKTSEPLELDKVFKQQLLSVLTDNKYNRLLPKRKRGKLDTKNLWRASTGVSNLFTQKQARKGRHYNVVLVIDQSGSMSGSKMRQAIETAVFLGKHFEAINIDYSVVGFADMADVHKPMSQKLDVKDLEYKLTRGQLGGGTNLFEGLKLAVKELRGQKGQSLIIAISDGQTDCANEARGILHANPEVRAFGVGIGTPCRVIPQNELIRDIDQLKPVIVNWLRTAIRRGV